ncbi:MAG: hypothetical protein QOE89_1222, partial [Pseudonocardiales bacterium]|nr:hypothetical protein [Pseudonocardiales bacterium]
MAIRAGERRLKKAPRGRSFASRNPT